MCSVTRLVSPYEMLSTKEPRDWKAHLSSYSHLQELVFASDREFDRAIDLLYTEELRTMPYDLTDESLVVPLEALSYFKSVNFEQRSLK